MAAVVRNDVDDEMAVDTVFNELVEVFPGIDPEYLQSKATEFVSMPETMNAWVLGALETNCEGFPTRQEYEARVKAAEEAEKFQADVSVEDLIRMFNGDPEAYFAKLRNQDGGIERDELYEDLAIGHLKKIFSRVPARPITKAFEDSKGSFLAAFQALQDFKGALRKTARRPHEYRIPTQVHGEFRKELIYAQKSEAVKAFLEASATQKAAKFEAARQAGVLVECLCCGDDECLEDDMVQCSGGKHLFCHECVERASSVAIGDGKTELRCLTDCGSVFPINSLQRVLSAAAFSKWLEKIQLADIERAGIEGLEQCPFCPYATVLEVPKNVDKIFRCLKPGCLVESCRFCKKPNHIPLPCAEVEEDDEVKRRTLIENRMAEALIRKCIQCQTPYIKLDGCNKITCGRCGALQCYLCRQSVSGYEHFVGQGAPNPLNKCPLWTNNDVLHEREVALGAKQAREELQRDEPGAEIRNDPAAGINLNVADRAEAINAAAAMYQPPPRPANDALHQPQEQLRYLEQVQRQHEELRNLLEHFRLRQPQPAAAALPPRQPVNLMAGGAPPELPAPLQPRQIAFAPHAVAHPPQPR